MAAKLKLDSDSSGLTRPQTRRTSRFRSQTRALVRSNHGDRSKALIRDVSIYGCSLDCEATWVRGGMFVSIRLAGDWSIQAVVRWVRGQRAGVEFLRPITQAEAAEISGD